MKFIIAFFSAIFISQYAVAQDKSTSFFVTSIGLGDGANLGGTEGADMHCQALAISIDQGNKNWKAYLSTQGMNPQNAKDRIGSGPWYNIKGIMVATSVDNLHSNENNLAKETNLNEKGEIIPGFGDQPNYHDILTGSIMDGTAFNSETDMTCGNWTSNDQGSAMVGHHDLNGGRPTWTWNTAHGSRGCSQQNLISTGGNGLFYCFAAN